MGGGVVGPIWVSFRDCDAVVEMEDEFHCEEGEQESNSVFDCAPGFYALGWVSELGDVVVEGEDWAGDVEGGVDGVCEVVAEIVVVCVCGDGDTISFRQI